MTDSTRTPAADAAPSAAAAHLHAQLSAQLHAQTVRAGPEPRISLPGAASPKSEPQGPRLLPPGTARRKPDDDSEALDAAQAPHDTLLAQAPATTRRAEPPAAGAPAAGGASSELAPAAAAAPSAMESRLLTPWSQAAPWASSGWFSGLGAAPAGAVGTGALLTLAALGGGGGSGGAAASTSDSSAPALGAASISDSAGNQLVLNYNEALSIVLPTASSFQVLVDGVINNVTAVTRGSDQQSVVLTLATAVTGPKTVSVSLADGSAIRDLAGNTAATFRDQAVTLTDKVAPSLLSSNAYTNAGNSVIVLRYSEDLLTSGTPSPSAFGVRVEGVAVPVTAVDVLGDSVRLRLGTAITAASPQVRLSYTPPTNTSLALQDAAGNRAEPLGASGGETVTHSQDTSAPGLDAAVTVGQQPRLIRLTFSETLDAGSLPAASSLSVDLSSAGSTRSVGVSAVKISGAVLELTLAETVSDPLAGLRVRYNPPASNPLRDWAGNAVTLFDRSVSTVDTVPPSPVSSRFTSDRALELTFNEALASLGAAQAAYTLTANGGATLKPVSTTVSGRTLTLTFDTAVQTGAAATLAYAAPASDASVLNRALQDSTGNDSASFSITPDTRAPQLSSARTTANGLQIELTYDEALLAPSSSGTPVIPAVTASAFTVLRNNVQQSTVSNVSITGSQVVLTLASALLPGDLVSLFYRPPTASIGVNNAAIQDASGNDAASLGSGVNGQEVTNQVAPAISRVSLDSQVGALDRVVIAFNEALNGSPDPGAFSVRVGNLPQTIARISGSGSSRVLELSSPIATAGELQVGYTQPASNPLVDADNNRLASSSSQAYGQVITGTASADTLSGQAGRIDYLLGSLGNDRLSGAGSTDTFVWPNFGAGGPGGWTHTLADFGFKQGSGSLQGAAEADVLDLRRLLEGYSNSTSSQFLRASKNSGGKLIVEIDHNGSVGGSPFSTSATLLFDNVTVDSSDRIVAATQFVNDNGSNLSLSNVLSHLMAQGQLLVL